MEITNELQNLISKLISEFDKKNYDLYIEIVDEREGIYTINYKIVDRLLSFEYVGTFHCTEDELRTKLNGTLSQIESL